MVRRETEIKFLSPSYHAFLTDILRRIYIARLKKELEPLVENMKFLYLSLPQKVKVETDNMIRNVIIDLRNKGLNDIILSSIDPNSPEPLTISVLNKALSYCMNYIAKYTPGKTMNEKYHQCFNRVVEYIDLIYNFVITASHKNNVFAISRSFWVGSNVGPEA